MNKNLISLLLFFVTINFSFGQLNFWSDLYLYYPFNGNSDDFLLGGGPEMGLTQIKQKPGAKRRGGKN